MSLRQALRSGVAAITIASVVAPAGLAAPPKAAPLNADVVPRGPLDVRVAQAREFSRVEFHWSGNARATTRRDGQTVVFSFSRDADPDIARLRTSPPRWIKGAEKRHVGGRLEVAITLADDADAKVGQADGASYLNAFEKPAPDPAKLAEAQAPPQEPEPPRPNPVPAGGVVRMDARVVNGQTLFTFAWANPAGAAVFRRGDAIWVVFDAPATLDISKAPKGLKQYAGLQAFRGPDYAAVRIDAARDVPLFAAAMGNNWTIALGPGDQSQPSIVRVTRDAAAGPASLKAPVAGATRVIALPDPAAGDTLTVVTALGPPKGLPSRREYIQLAMLPSIQGLAIEPRVEDLHVERDGDLVYFRRANGLTLSPAWATQERAQSEIGAPMPAGMPALIDTSWSKTGQGGFLARYHSLLAAATAEAANKDKAAPVAARMALARFLVGSELS
ncbi:MAG: endoglucanase, partial [Phenylobacterium sp.]